MYDPDRVGDLVNGINAAEIAFLECMRAAGNQRRNNIR
jgi:hypothetical protein